MTRTLEGCRIAITRERAAAADLAARIETLGGEALVCPAIAIVPPADTAALDRALRRLPEYDWLAFTSANAVHAVAARLAALAIDPSAGPPPRLAAVGPATAAAASRLLRPPDLTASVHTGEALAAELDRAGAGRVLFSRGELASDVLPTSLRAAGVTVDEVVAYRTVAGDGITRLVDRIRARTVDAILFASPSAARFTLDACPESDPDLDGMFRPSPSPAIFCLGPSTAAAVRERGIEPAGVAEAFTNEGLIDTVAGWFTEHRRGH